MPRRKRLRRVVAPPGFAGYKPYGNLHGKRECVELLYEEYEAIKLSDYDLMKHQEAAELMGVSRATFARIYEDARRKIARALVETREIRSAHGNAWVDDNWYICRQCHARFSLPGSTTFMQCPICRSENIYSLKEQQ